MIDVENSKIMSRATVKIRKGEIASITKSKDADMQESGYTSIDCSGLYMCPGLIDCQWSIPLLRVNVVICAHAD